MRCELKPIPQSCSPTSREEWLNSLTGDQRQVGVEVHDPADRKHLAYLATTRSGQRIYLNRTAVDAYDDNTR